MLTLSSMELIPVPLLLYFVVAVVFGGPLQLCEFHFYSLDTVNRKLESSPYLSAVLVMQFHSSASHVLLPDFLCNHCRSCCIT